MVPPSRGLCSSNGEEMSLLAEERIYDLFINQRHAECHGIDTMSNGSMSLTWVICGIRSTLRPLWEERAGTGLRK